MFMCSFRVKSHMFSWFIPKCIYHIFTITRQSPNCQLSHCLSFHSEKGYNHGTQTSFLDIAALKLTRLKLLEQCNNEGGWLQQPNPWEPPEGHASHFPMAEPGPPLPPDHSQGMVYRNTCWSVRVTGHWESETWVPDVLRPSQAVNLTQIISLL